MTLEQLPYEVWEIIFWKLDGASLLALSCVSHACHRPCQSFLKVRTNEYWRKLCLRELNTLDIQLCQSGALQENWYTVYKAAHIKNTMQCRRVLATTIDLYPRFKKFRTGVHIIGDYLVITLGQIISICDAKTGNSLMDRGIGGYNIHESCILRKNGTEMHRSNKCGVLACDVLVLLVGGSHISHMAVLSAQSIFEPCDMLLPINYTLDSGSSSERSFICQRFNNRVCLDNVSVEITVRDSKLSVNKIPVCPCHLPAATYDHRSGPLRTALEMIDKGGSHFVDTYLNSSVTVSVNDASNLVVCTKERDAVHTMNIPVEGELWHKPPDNNIQFLNYLLNVQPPLTADKTLISTFEGPKAILKQDAMKILHDGRGVLPVIATLQMSEEKGKHVVLYSFPL